MSIKSIIRGLDFFINLNDEQLDILSDISSLSSYNKDYILCYEKSKSDKLLFLIEGLAKSYKIDKRDNEIFLYYIEKNNIISEITTTMDNDTIDINSNISFIEDSKVLSIDYKLFKKKFLNNHILTNEFINEIVARNKKLEFLINREFIFDAVTKVAIMLNNDLEIFNRLKRHEISLMLHIQPSTLSRVLNRLKRNNIISITLGKVNVLDKEALQRICKEY